MASARQRRRRCRGIPKPQRSRRLYRSHAHFRVPVALKDPGAGCLQGARRSFRSPDPRRVPIRRVPCLLASLQAVTAPAWLAIDADVVVTEARIVGSGFGRWPPAGHRIAGRRTRTERRHVPQVWAGPSGQSRCPRKGHCFLGVFQLERVLSSCWAVSRSGRDAPYGRESSGCARRGIRFDARASVRAWAER